MNTYKQAALLWLQIILKERFGHDFIISQTKSDLVCVRLSGANGEISFPRLEPAFHQSISDFPCHSWDARSEGWLPILELPLPAPGFVKLVTPLIHRTETGYAIHYDILGLTYWMLSRLEEVGRTDLDIHDRFPASASHAFKNEYLSRPIVDEWLDILGQVMQRLWPAIKLTQHQFSMHLSHDVDAPARYAFVNARTLVRRMAGDLVRGNLKAFCAAPLCYFGSQHEIYSKDSANTFDWIMDVSEKHGLKSAFYFICGRTEPAFDADYEIEHPAIRSLLRRIHARGHEIGLHPSYNTYKNPSAVVDEANRLKKVCGEEGIEQNEWGGRMHYLRWQQPVTLNGWEIAGMTYDSTLGYAEMPGFRCGTCFEYSAFNPVSHKKMNVRIRPLIAMEVSLLASSYMGLKTKEAFDLLSTIKKKCHMVGGGFSLLWHNSNLEKKSSCDLYQKIVSIK